MQEIQVKVASPGAEKDCAESQHGGTFSNCDREVRTHTHRTVRQAQGVGQRSKGSKALSRGHTARIKGCNRHEPSRIDA
jgi:hypothetical protein